MRVLVVGNGGREHALAWGMRSDAEILCTPRNPGIEEFGRCFDVAVDDLEGITSLVLAEKADLVVVGPELPLTLGLADHLRGRGIPVFGPSKAAAQIEGSKVFAKDLMRKYAIPTADFESFTEPGPALAYLRKKGAPIVVKASGLAAGKGALVCMTAADAEAAIRGMLAEGQFGDAGREIVIEEFMQGEEASILAVTDGESIAVLPAAQDHKRVFDQDQGPNTGGMGAYAPAPCVTPAILQEVHQRILRATVDALAAEGCAYSGVLYAGLMLTAQGPRVVEFNCRFGDPETQAVVPLIESSLTELLHACSQNLLGKVPLKIRDGAATCVVLASGGYPGHYEKGRKILGLDHLPKNAMAFHAGTRKTGPDLVTSGGRVLGITGLGRSLADSIRTAYEGVGRIRFEGMHFRRDIGAKGLQRVMGQKARQ